MFNYAIVCLPYLPIALVAFCTGVLIGAPASLMLGLIEGNIAGILGGAFFCLLCGIALGVTGFVFALVFNVLSPYMGGLPVKIEAAGTDTPSAVSQPPDANSSSDAPQPKSLATCFMRSRIGRS